MRISRSSEQTQTQDISSDSNSHIIGKEAEDQRDSQALASGCEALESQADQATEIPEEANSAAGYDVLMDQICAEEGVWKD